MKRRRIMKTLLFVILVSMVSLVQAATNSEIKKELIRQSIASYSGSCPCPYNVARNAVGVVAGVHIAAQEVIRLFVIRLM